QAALKAESSKVAKYEKACLENQHVFIPFAFDTFGFLAPETEKFLNRVQRVVQNECLALIFNYLTTTNDRNNSSLVSHRWLRIDAQTRTRLTLHAHPNLQPFIPSIFTRFNSLTQLVLHSDPNSSSINDHELSLIASRCPNLTRLKLSACSNITYKGIIALLNTCSSLEELSVKHIRYGRLFEPLIIVSNNLKTLKLIALFGEWERCLEMITASGNSLVEVHLEHVDVTDIGLLALSKCSSLEILHLESLLHCTNSGLISVAENCKGLKKLYIDNRMWNSIRNDGLIAIAKYCLNLEELVLIGVDACCISLEAIAVNCQKLERLDLCLSNKITDLEISYIAEKCVAMKKVLIKQCCVSDKGVEAFALGCPNLVEIRLTKCENVTREVKDRLRARRGSLVVKLDAIKSKIVNAVIGDCGVQEHVVDVPPATEHVVVSEP
nr:hypothetical protein [Tanacetum cinerariifolium]